jgi:hypothetical protein
MERSLKAGDVILGKYRMERVLGKGGMGEVLAVRHLELDDLFAIKLLLPKVLEKPDAVERFLREARAAAHLKGEHLVKVMDVGRLEDGSPYMIMEYLTGSDLAAVARERGPLPLKEALDYVLQACEAIAEAHAAGIIHRDLKPANLFLTRRANGAAFIKVLDFGISKRQDSTEEDLTQSGAIVGSPHYMSPEQMRRSKTVDARGDIWSMGVVLYRLVTGVPPFQGENAGEVLAGVLQDDPEPPSSIVPDLPPELDAIIARALQKKPDRRYQSMNEFAVALRDLLGEEPAPISRGAPLSVRAVTDIAAAPTLAGATLEPSPGAPVGRKKTSRAVMAAAVTATALAAAAGGWLIHRWTAPAPARPVTAAASDTASALADTAAAPGPSAPSAEVPAAPLSKVTPAVTAAPEVAAPTASPGAAPTASPSAALTARQQARPASSSPPRPEKARPADAGSGAAGTRPPSAASSSAAAKKPPPSVF